MPEQTSLKETAAAIAMLMPGWSVKKDDCAWSVTIEGPDGEGLHITNNKQPDKLHISGLYPRQDGYHFGQAVAKDLPEIGVSKTRPAAEIVKEIGRRLLPRYREVLALARQALKRHQEFQGGIESLTAELSKLVGYKRPEENRSGRAKGYIDIPSDINVFYGSATVHSPDSVEISIRSAKPEVARRVLRALVQEDKTGKGELE